MPCPICNDTGFRQSGSRLTRCDCRLQNMTELLLKAARIPRRYQHCELSNFDVLPGKHEQSQARARLMAGRFVEELPADREHKGLLLMGPIGTGKTHLAVGIVKELVRHGTRCLFYDYRELLKEIQNSYNPSVQATEMEVLRPVLEVEVLALDELGAVKASEWVWDTVSFILNTRYNEQRTTIITTNLPDLPPAAEGDAAWKAQRETTLGDRITERMRSRLHEMCKLVEVQGEDFRQRVKSASF